MSADTLNAIHAAIEAHAVACEQEGIVTDYFIGYGLAHAEEGVDGYVTTISYAASPSSPHATYGIGHLALRSMRDDIEGRWVADDDD